MEFLTDFRVKYRYRVQNLPKNEIFSINLNKIGKNILFTVCNIYLRLYTFFVSPMFSYVVLYITIKASNSITGFDKYYIC